MIRRLAFALAASGAAAVTSARAAPDFAALDTSIVAEMKASATPGAAVAVGVLLLLLVAARRARTGPAPASRTDIAPWVVRAHAFGSHVLLAPRPPPLG